MPKYGTVVIGAGLTGLSFAYHYDKKIPIYEQNATVGGLVRTLKFNSYRFDFAPHLLHLRTDYVKRLLFDTLGLDCKKHKRKAAIYFEKKIIPYPFELNLYALSNKVKSDCLKGLNAINSSDRAKIQTLQFNSYREYALNAFGSGIANHYLLPYNRKVWDTEPGELTCEWMGFLPTANVEEILDSVERLSHRNNRFGYNPEFFYPSNGGIQELPDVFANKLLNINLNKRVYEIDVFKKKVEFVDGKYIHYERLVSTIPLNKLIFMINLKKYSRLASELKNTSVYSTNIVIDGKVPEGLHWLYFPDNDYDFYRISFPKNYFQNCSPNDEQVITVEVGSRDHNLNIEKLMTKIIKQILTMDIFDINDIIYTRSMKIPVAYCIFDKNRSRVVKILREELENFNIISVGSYGQWNYLGMEDVILRGRELALKMKEL